MLSASMFSFWTTTEIFYLNVSFQHKTNVPKVPSNISSEGPRMERRFLYAQRSGVISHLLNETNDTDIIELFDGLE